MFRGHRAQQFSVLPHRHCQFVAADGSLMLACAAFRNPQMSHSEKKNSARGGPNQRSHRQVVRRRLIALDCLHECVFCLLVRRFRISPGLRFSTSITEHLGRRCYLCPSLLGPGSRESTHSADTKTQPCTQSDCLAQHRIPSFQVKRQRLSRGDSQRWGKDHTRNSVAGSPGEPEGITDQQNAIHPYAVHKRSGCIKGIASSLRSVPLLYIPVVCAAQRNRRSHRCKCGGPRPTH